MEPPSRLDALHRRAARLIRDLDRETSISNFDRLDFLRWLGYEISRRAAPLEEADDDNPGSGSSSGGGHIYI